jgi:hypothetical protein
MPKAYADQVVHNLWVTGAAWCDFLSYQPHFDERLQVKLVRVHRDERVMRDYEAQLRLFLRELDNEMSAMRTMADMAGALQESLVS